MWELLGLAWEERVQALLMASEYTGASETPCLGDWVGSKSGLKETGIEWRFETGSSQKNTQAVGLGVGSNEG